jgi:TcpE family
MSAERVPIRSYRGIFSVDRRIYRIEQWRIPVPGGIPLRAFLYYFGALIAVLLLSRLPVLGDALGLLHPAYLYVIGPIGVAVLGTRVVPDGRAPHRFARDWIAFRVRTRRRSAGRIVPLEGEQVSGVAPLALGADEHGIELRRARVTGAGQVAFRDPVELRRGRRGRLTARPVVAGRRRRGTVTETVELAPGERLEVRP